MPEPEQKNPDTDAGAGMIVSVDFERFDKNMNKTEHIRVYPDGREEKINFEV